MDIGLQAHEEEEQYQTQVGDDIEVGDTGSREDSFGESGNMAHNRGTQNNAADDLGDDSRLADLGERPVDEATEDDDDDSLNDKYDNGVFRVIVSGITPLQDTTLWGSSVAGRSRSGGGGAARHDAGAEKQQQQGTQQKLGKKKKPSKKAHMDGEADRIVEASKPRAVKDAWVLQSEMWK